MADKTLLRTHLPASGTRGTCPSREIWGVTTGASKDTRALLRGQTLLDGFGQSHDLDSFVGAADCNLFAT